MESVVYLHVGSVNLFILWFIHNFDHRWCFINKLLTFEFSAHRKDFEQASSVVMYCGFQINRQIEIVLYFENLFHMIYVCGTKIYLFSL